MDEIEVFLNMYYQASFGALTVENDFSDFDRSQERVATALDIALLSMLGMHPEDLDEWARGHYKHSNISFSLGLVAYLRYVNVHFSTPRSMLTRTLGGKESLEMSRHLLVIPS